MFSINSGEIKVSIFLGISLFCGKKAKGEAQNFEEDCFDLNFLG
jgi:hypothetical protein